jgi:hypothetical protein
MKHPPRMMGRDAGSAAHQASLLTGVTKAKPVEIPVKDIASIGFPLKDYASVEKVQRMQRNLRKTGKLKPVRVVSLTPENRGTYGVTDPSKKFFLTNGHHRFAAAKLEGMTTIRAVDYFNGKRI